MAKHSAIKVISPIKALKKIARAHAHKIFSRTRKVVPLPLNENVKAKTSVAQHVIKQSTAILKKADKMQKVDKKIDRKALKAERKVIKPVGIIFEVVRPIKAKPKAVKKVVRPIKAKPKAVKKAHMIAH